MAATVVVSLKDQGQCSDIAAGIAGVRSVRAITVGPLYHLPDDHGLWELLRKANGTLVVVSEMHPRPVEWLLRERGVAWDNLHCVDAREFDDPTDIVHKLVEVLPDAAGTAENVGFETEYAERWYPVIDRSRCVSCGHCVQFCLFGVYSSSEKVSVVQPDCCKPGCPACSRVCPHGAIIFPLYDKDPAISGAPGRIMTPDPAARAMFYKRTGAVCPVCSVQAAADAFAGTHCPECGREIPVKADRQTEDELDRLINEFDKLQFGG